jgi:digeranylgeranylglycerophospholipid reductase
MEKTDVLIAGGGPAGLGLAKKLAEAGVDFILLEEHKDFFQKACGEGLCRRDREHDMTELHGGKAGIANETDTLSIFINSSLLIKVESEAYVLDKTEFEKDMARQAIKKGGEIRMNQRFLSFERTDGWITANPQGIACRCLVGCDGAFSKVREFFGERPSVKAFAIAAYEQKKEEDHDLKFYIGKNVISGGYAWRFPKKDSYNVGVGALRKDIVMPAYRRLFDAEDMKGAFIPSDLPCRTYFEGGILIGDAASQTDAFTGGGINYSLIASKLAADVLAKISRSGGRFSEQNLKEYESLWKKAMYAQLRNSYLLGRFVARTGLTDKDFLLRRLKWVLKTFMKK